MRKILLGFLAFCFVVALYAFKSPGHTKAHLKKAIAYDMAKAPKRDTIPQEGDNARDWLGADPYARQANQNELARQDIKSARKRYESQTSARVCLFIYDPHAPETYCRYAVWYDCNSGYVFGWTTTP